MKHKFVVVIEGSFSRESAQYLLRDIGLHQGSLPPEERLSFDMAVYPIQNKPTLIKRRE